ncbi:hypothetical protein GCM10008904_21100 [Paraclostridium ghonii]|uniref:Uncharacterized protein n=1 Tax=Paraclostridium ghonii TaxID=29358 RepID=A0ABU0N010_9FIRM|nr:hypothetical protein [Paeniclostridium ghonii]MDQ0556501.1 hypothetical protein [Paeniclostridium ghonii]
MRWALVILLLYVLPLWILFKNKEDFKRASMYGCMYVVVATVIVVCNIYISTLNKIENFLEYKSYSFNEEYENNIERKTSTKEPEIDEAKKTHRNEKEALNVDKVYNESESNINKVDNISIEENDKEAIKNFKSEIYKIERKALVPMRKCIPDTKNIKIDTKSINKAKKDVEYAKKMCDEVVKIYEEMEVPKLSSEEDTNQLEYSKICVQKAYILRGKAMECAQKMLKTKNLKYVSQIKEYLSLSDKEIKNFVDTIKSL